MGYSFIIKGKLGEDHFLPHSWVGVKLLSSASPPRSSRGFFPIPTWSSQDCHGTTEMSKKTIICTENGKSCEVSVQFSSVTQSC